jgi:ComF family protein
MKWILDMLFPEACIGCGKRGEILCPSCIQNLRHNLKETPAGIVAAFDYRDPVIKKAIWNLKYHRRSHIGETLGKLLYETYIEEVSDIRTYTSGQPILVIPVPLSTKRRKNRGYNQAEKIAVSFCKCAPANIFALETHAIRRSIHTNPQAHIANRNERLRNVKGVFSIQNTDMLKGRTVIVIDDVTTTGGTLKEVCSILKKAGTKKVYGFAIAH